MNSPNQIQLSFALALGLKNTASDKTTALGEITSSENVQNGLKQGNYFSHFFNFGLDYVTGRVQANLEQQKYI
jgi:hypothetical protein